MAFVSNVRRTLTARLKVLVKPARVESVNRSLDIAAKRSRAHLLKNVEIIDVDLNACTTQIVFRASIAVMVERVVVSQNVGKVQR